MEEKPKVIGKVKVVICSDCHLVQAWGDVVITGHCTAETQSKGWRKCFSISFLELE